MPLPADPDPRFAEYADPRALVSTAWLAGHIPGAASIPWKQAAEDDGRFKPAPALRALYEQEAGLGDDVVAYCRIGERSSHTWFVLRYLLGHERVRNYDGSWTEWGSLVRAPIATGDEQGG